LIHPRYRVSKKKNPESFTAASMPTEEQIQQAGDFQSLSPISNPDSRERCEAGIVSDPIPSEIPDMEPRPCLKSERAKCVITLPSGHYSVSIDPKNKVGDSYPSYRLARILAESGPEPKKSQHRVLVHQDDERKSEISRTKEAIGQAQEIKNHIDAAYDWQNRALRTYEWVYNTCAPGSIFTPPDQIKTSAVGYYEPSNAREISAFSSSSASETPRKIDMPTDQGKEDDPFITPPNKCPRPPKSTPKLPLPNCLLPDGALTLRKRRQNRHLSPCAYRSRKEADILFNALQEEVRVPKKPFRRITEPETDLERLDRLFNTANLDNTRHDMIAHLGLSEDASSEELIFDFDETINSSLINAKGGNDGFFKDAKDMLRRMNGEEA
jgi:hypothetical protein